MYSALDRPGDYGPIRTAREGNGITVTGPAGSLTVSGAADIQALRLRLEEMYANFSEDMLHDPHEPYVDLRPPRGT